jgi:hypothetical protein
VRAERFGRPLARAAALALLGTLVGCSGKDASPRVEHPSAAASESALAKSGLPGARGVGRAMELADSAEARRRREDSISRAPP